MTIPSLSSSARIGLVVALAGLMAAWAPVDTPDPIITLVTGESFQGRVVKRSSDATVYATALGERQVLDAMVVGERPATEAAAEYQQRASNLDRSDLDAHLELARWCAARGLTSGLDQELEIILARDPLSEWAWSQLRRMAPHYELGPRNGVRDIGGDRWQRKQVDLLYRAIPAKGFVKSVLIAAQLEALPIELQVNQAIRLAERGRTMERFVALRLLAGVDETRRVKTLYRAALSDASWRARHMAVDSLAQRDDGTTFRPFVKALLKHPEPFVQVNAAEALGQLGDRRGVAPLVRALKGTQDGRVARSNFQSINQIAYVKDYDVEVAQTAFIADPVVDVVLDGMVLDVGVIDIQRQRVIYGRALGRLTQAKVDPESIGAWMDWWRQEGKSKFGSR